MEINTNRKKWKDVIALYRHKLVDVAWENLGWIIIALLVIKAIFILTFQMNN